MKFINLKNNCMIVPRTNLCMTCICTNDWSQLYHTYISGVSVNGKITNSLILSSLSLSTMIWPELQCIGSFFLVSLLCTGVNSLDIPNIDCKFVSSDASSCLLFGFTSYYKTNCIVNLIQANRKIYINNRLLTTCKDYEIMLTLKIGLTHRLWMHIPKEGFTSDSIKLVVDDIPWYSVSRISWFW